MPAITAAAITGGAALASGAIGGASTSDKRTAKLMRLLASSGFEPSPTNRVIQNLLPFGLQSEQIGPSLTAGLQGIGNLMQNPGSLSPTIASAIAPRLAAESESIAQNFRGIGAEQAGAAARSNTPVSIRSALDSALMIAQERAQRGARRDVMMESESLRRDDLSQTYAVLDAILQYISSARGQAIQGLGATSGMGGSDRAAQLAFVGSMLSSAASSGGGKTTSQAEPLK